MTSKYLICYLMYFLPMFITWILLSIDYSNRNGSLHCNGTLIIICSFVPLFNWATIGMSMSIIKTTLHNKRIIEAVEKEMYRAPKPKWRSKNKYSLIGIA